jgi:hypothetical protein
MRAKLSSYANQTSPSNKGHVCFAEESWLKILFTDLLREKDITTSVSEGAREARCDERRHAGRVLYTRIYMTKRIAQQPKRDGRPRLRHYVHTATPTVDSSWIPRPVNARGSFGNTRSSGGAEEWGPRASYYPLLAGEESRRAPCPCACEPRRRGVWAAAAGAGAGEVAGGARVQRR